MGSYGGAVDIVFDDGRTTTVMWVLEPDGNGALFFPPDRPAPDSLREPFTAHLLRGRSIRLVATALSSGPEGTLALVERVTT